jgi:6,7-dimethyl-8-ribityllumazine synthase
MTSSAPATPYQANLSSCEGRLALPPDVLLAIVVSRFNDLITQRLLDGALWQAQRLNLAPEQLVVLHCPGAFELPVVAKQLATHGYQGRKVGGILALGCVIKGSTSHYDHVCAAATSGLQHVATSTGIPVGFGVLTTDTVEQALDRAGVKLGNKGAETLTSVVEVMNLLHSSQA